MLTDESIRPQFEAKCQSVQSRIGDLGDEVALLQEKVRTKDVSDVEWRALEDAFNHLESARMALVEFT